MVSSLPPKRSQEEPLREERRLLFLPPRLHPLSGHGNETLEPSSRVPPGAVLSLGWVPCPLQHACHWRYSGDIRGEPGSQVPAHRQAWQRRTQV